MSAKRPDLRLIREDPDQVAVEQLALLAELIQEFASSLNLDETLQTAIERFMAYMDAEAASLFLLENENRELVCYKCVGPVDISGLRMDVSEGIVGKCVREQACQMVRDVRRSHDFSGTIDHSSGFSTRSLLCAPLSVRGECVGVLELVNKRTGDGLFNPRDEALASVLASAAALAIHNARMAASLVEHERLKRELELAGDIQRHLLPPSCDSDFPVNGVNFPAYEVSGDFYDFFPLDNGRIYFNLADVSGKGINSALLMAQTSSLLRCLARDFSDPGELLTRVNRELCETASHGMFVTIVSGFIEPESGRVCFSNAGHQPPLQRGVDGSFSEIPAGAPPLGVVPETVFPVSEISLAGGSLYLFTDGVTESLTAEHLPLDVSGLITLIERMSELESCERLQNIVAEIRRPGARQRDDITMMLIESQDTGLGEKLFERRFSADPECLHGLRTELKSAALQAGCSAEVAGEIVLAVNEACMNIMQHAYQGDCAGEILLEMHNNDGELVCVLKDWAAPVDPSQIRPRPLDELRPGGLGTRFIDELMDDWVFDTTPQGCGNCLTLRKRIA